MAMAQARWTVIKSKRGRWYGIYKCQWYGGGMVRYTIDGLVPAPTSSFGCLAIIGSQCMEGIDNTYISTHNEIYASQVRARAPAVRLQDDSKKEKGNNSLVCSLSSSSRQIAYHTTSGLPRWSEQHASHME